MPGQGVRPRGWGLGAVPALQPVDVLLLLLAALLSRLLVPDLPPDLLQYPLLILGKLGGSGPPALGPPQVCALPGHSGTHLGEGQLRGQGHPLLRQQLLLVLGQHQLLEVALALPQQGARHLRLLRGRGWGTAVGSPQAPQRGPRGGDEDGIVVQDGTVVREMWGWGGVGSGSWSGTGREREGTVVQGRGRGGTGKGTRMGLCFRVRMGSWSRRDEDEDGDEDAIMVRKGQG